ncbi:MAG: LLM class F420-dependent oxidoreductase [Acidimicrobiales bacterium]|jgi:F420-dependent oxidoreductase-like protein|nr:LLM class F420-dependent oxidoreductase [Acidimicrobiales bacterium]HJM98402.1 LLM class F420-dependent oxidoreductase [Acidimicrobiales bacterium]
MGIETEISVKVAPHHIDWETLLWVAVIADESPSFSHFWNFDHFYPIQGDTRGPCLESWVTLTAIAQATKRIRIGCMVNGIHYRHPAVVANMASALDIVSGGRFELGLGAGWNEEESSAYGIELGSLKERFDRFEEALAIITSLISMESTTFSGEFFNLQDALNEPKGPQQPLPICIGGTGERRTLKCVAKHATHWNLPFFDLPVFQKKHQILKNHCEGIGRNPNEISVSTHVLAGQTTELKEIYDQVVEQSEAGIDQSIIYFQPLVDRNKIESVLIFINQEFG